MAFFKLKENCCRRFLKWKNLGKKEGASNFDKKIKFLLSTKSSFRMSKQLTKNTIRAFCGVHVSQFVRNDQNYVKTFNAFKNHVYLVPQVPHSPDMELCDFFLFPRCELHRFGSIEAIQKKHLATLKAIPETKYNNCFDDWKKC